MRSITKGSRTSELGATSTDTTRRPMTTSKTRISPAKDAGDRAARALLLLHGPHTVRQADSMKIEHWLCQADYPSETNWDYRNLLGACLGGVGQPGKRQHCDTRKGDQTLMWNPAKLSHQIESRVRYELDGSIHGNEAEFDGQLNQVLNLNLPFAQARAQEPSRRCAWVGGRYEKGSAQEDPCQATVLFRNGIKYVAGSGQLGPYCQVVCMVAESAH